MSNHTKCNWCNNTCYNGHLKSPDYRINFCSRKCMTEYYNRFGVPDEKIQWKKLCDKRLLRTSCKFKGSPILFPQNFELDFGQGLMRIILNNDKP